MNPSTHGDVDAASFEPDTVGGVSGPAPWTHVWHWHKRPVDRDRYGMRCRVLATSRLQSAQVLFEDGITHITSRRGLRRINLENT